MEVLTTGTPSRSLVRIIEILDLDHINNDCNYIETAGDKNIQSSSPSSCGIGEFSRRRTRSIASCPDRMVHEIATAVRPRAQKTELDSLIPSDGRCTSPRHVLLIQNRPALNDYDH